MSITNEPIQIVNLAEIGKKTYAFHGAESIVVTQDNKIILQKRGDNWNHFPGYLSSFGGQIEAGETPLQALIRELNEELGAQVKETDVVFLGTVTEAITKHTELIHIYFWRDLLSSITGCYEGEIVQFDNIQYILKQPKIMDSTRWALNECLAKKLL